MKVAATAVLAILSLSLGDFARAGAMAADARVDGQGDRGPPHVVPMFGGAYLGMTLAEWRALPRPAALPPNARPTCSRTPGGGAGSATRRPTALENSPVVVCGYLARYGDLTLPEAFQLTPKYLVRNARYTFQQGRLSAIAFQTSIDAFDDLVARFTTRYGPASETMRDKVVSGDGIETPRVRKIWRLSGQSIRITDPSTRFDRLSVQITAQNAATPTA